MYSQHPQIAKRFEAETPSGPLPKYAPTSPEVGTDPLKQKRQFAMNALAQLARGK